MSPPSGVPAPGAPTPGAPALGVQDVVWLRVEDPSDAGAARRAATDLAARLAFPEQRASELALVVTEVATNLCKHAEQGAVLLRAVRAGDAVGVGVVAVDGGPGVRDLPALALDGVSSTGTLGLGLGAIARLSSGLEVHSVPGRGTVLVTTVWSGSPPQALAAGRDDVAGITRPMTGEEECGDAVAVRWVEGVALLLHVDGLGHGPLAARAGAEAVRLFHDAPGAEPAAVLAHVHRGLSHTRGAAALVAAVDRAQGQVRHAGLGNISGVVVSDGQRRGLVSSPGIAGHNARALRQVSGDLPEGALVVLHSDGVRERWDLRDEPGVLAHGALVVAATLLRDAGGRRDDASVLVDLPAPVTP